VGHGRTDITKDDKALVRTLIDGCTGTPERIDFVSGPTLGAGIVRILPEAFPQYRGEKPMLACTAVPEAEPMAKWRKSNPRVCEALKAAKRLCAKAFAENVERRLPEFRAANPGTPDEDLRRAIQDATEGEVLGLDFVVYWDGTPITVRNLLGCLELLGDPIDLLDPCEPDYGGGRQVARAYLNSDTGSAYINSFVAAAPSI